MAEPVAVRRASDKRAKVHRDGVVRGARGERDTLCGIWLQANDREVVPLTQVPPDQRCKRCWPGSAR